MPTIITNSNNISAFDIKIVGDICAGVIKIDATPTTYIASGSLVVRGVNVKVTSPLGVVIKNFTTSGYDISGGSPPMQAVVSVSIPTEAGNYQYGNYVVNATIYDANGTEYKIEKTVYIDYPDSKNKTRKYGVIGAEISGLCQDGKATIQVGTPPAYRGKTVQSQVNDFTLYYPIESGLAPLVITQTAFSVPLFEGEYKIIGEICATYNYGDNVFVAVKYKLNESKKLKCILNYECIGIQLASLADKLNTNCTEAEKKATNDSIINILALVKAVEFLSEYNQDTSDYINQLDALLGCSCTCDGMTGTQIINNAPSKDVVIAGVNVTKTTVGLTDTYTINNYEYVVAVADNGGAFTVSAAVLSGGIKTQTLIFNISNVYTQIKALANTTPEETFWASVVNKVLTPMTSVPAGWATYTFIQRLQYILGETTLDLVAQNGLKLLTYTTTYPNDFTIELGTNPLLRNTEIPLANFRLLLSGSGGLDVGTLGDASTRINASKNTQLTDFPINAAIYGALGYFGGGSGSTSVYGAVIGTIFVNLSANLTIPATRVIAGVEGIVSFLSNYNITDGYLCGVDGHAVLTGTGNIPLLAAVRGGSPLQDAVQPNYTGTIPIACAFLIEQQKAASGIGLRITAGWGMYQVGNDNHYLIGKIVFDKTLTAGGTTSTQTINKPSGSVNAAAAATSVTVTNSLITTSSMVYAVFATNDATGYVKNVVCSIGAFVVNFGAAVTAESKINFIVFN